MTGSMVEKTNVTVNVLVVGDWVIDENWIIAGYESDTSSHVGREHYRSTISEPNVQILGLCGAGNVARALHGLHEKEVQTPEPEIGTQDSDSNVLSDNTKNKIDEPKTHIQVHGMGLWNPNDTKLLAALFSNDIIKFEAPLTLCGLEPSGEPSKKNRVSLCGKRVDEGACKCKTKETPEDACLLGPIECDYLKSLYPNINSLDKATIRAIRLYHVSGGSDPVLKYRIDWEKHQPYIPEKTHIEELLTDLKAKWDIQHIVVSDHHKGCISKDLIKYLKNQYENAKWYIRTKDIQVNWPNLIDPEKLVLRFIGADFIPNRSDTKRWFYGKEVSSEAIDELKKKGGINKLKYEHERWVISIHNDNSILALHKPSNAEINNTEIYSLVSKSEKQSINVGRSSIVFATCVASLLDCYGPNDHELMIKRSSINGQRWSESCVQNFRSFLQRKDNRLHGDHANSIKHYRTNREEMVKININKNQTVNEIKNIWNMAHKDCGIVRVDGKDVFQLWRGYSCVNGYIAIRPRLRKDLNILYQSIRTFLNGSRSNSFLNCLILGRPGFGKTYLADRLAETFKLNPLFFNLSQLTSLDHVIDCFDAISSLQNQQKNQPVLAFFDEIDADIGNQSPISLFLSPIWDGTYRRGSYSFKLAPCIWLFAGANQPGVKTKKASDFNSRINGPIISLNCVDDDLKGDERKTEQVYWGVRLLLKQYFDISSISKDVLKFFYDMNLPRGPRSLTQAVQKFRNIQYGVVKARNLPHFEAVKDLFKDTSFSTKSEYEKLLKKVETGSDIVSIIESPPEP